MRFDNITPGAEVLVKLDRAPYAIARVERKGVALRSRRGKTLNSGIRVVTTEDARANDGGILRAGHRATISSRDVREPASTDARQRVGFAVKDREYAQSVRDALKKKGVSPRYRGGEIVLSLDDAAKLAGLSE